MEPFEVMQLHELKQSYELMKTDPGKAGQRWLALSANFALWGDIEHALRAHAFAEPEPEQRHGARLLEAWLLEESGQTEAARKIYRTLLAKNESRASILRLLICLELRQRLYQRAFQISQELIAEDDQTVPASSLLLHGLTAFAVRNDLDAYKHWIELSKRPPSTLLPEGMFGMACLSFEQHDVDAALGWFVQGLEIAAPTIRRNWLASSLATRLRLHPDFDRRTAPFTPEPEEDPGKLRQGLPVFISYMEFFEELQRPDTHLRVRIHEEKTEYRTIFLLDPERDLPEKPDLPDAEEDESDT